MRTAHPQRASSQPPSGLGMFAWRRHLQARRGTALLEAVFVIPVMLILLMFIVDLGRAVYAKNALADATQTAVRAASQRGGVRVSGVNIAQRAFNEALNNTPGMNPSAASLTRAVPTECRQGAHTVELQSRYNFQFATPAMNTLLQFTGNSGNTGSGLVITGAAALRCEILWR